jgi:hypothetical protein
MKGILEVIKLIYGSKALSKILGTRTNVIRLPDNELKQYTKSDLNIEAASDKLAQKAKADMKELLADYPRMNDAEKLIFEGNLRRLGNKLGVTEKGPAADVLEFGTGEKVSPEGIMSLTEKAGQKNPPTTLMGNLESRIKQLEASGEDLSKMKGQTYDEFMNDITQGQRTMIKLEDEGLVRATAREIIDKDIKSKKIKLPKEIEADFKQGGGEPIDVFRQFYGEDALEQLNSMVPDFKQMYSSKEAADAATKKFKFEFKADRPPGSISIEDAKKAEQEFGINKPKQNEATEVTDITAKVYRNADPDELIGEYNKNLDLLSQVDEEGGTLIGYEQFKKLQNRNTEIEKILNSIGIKSADSPEGKKITEALIGKPKASVTELVTAEKIISDMKKMDPMDAMKEANKVLKKEGKYKNLQEKDVERIMEDTNDFIFGRDIPEDPEGFAKGGAASKGLDYLAGVERREYAEGSPNYEVRDRYLQYLRNLESAQNPTSANLLYQSAPNILYRGGDSSTNSDTVSNTTAGKSMSNISLADVAQAIGFAMNPALGIANMVATEAFGKSPMSMAMNALGFGDSSSTGTANATDTGDMGSEAANNAATDAANASVGAGDGSSSDGGSTGSCGSFKNGGYITGASVRPNLNIGGRVRMAGGGISQGLDYLMGIERRGYAEGGTGPSPDAAETYSEYKARMLEALRKSHGGQKTAYTDVQPDGSSSGISRDLPIEDYFNYMLADAYALGFNPNTGLKFGVDDRGVLTDQYKFKQEMADFKKNSQTTPTEDFSDYLNTTTINTNVQTTPTEDFSDSSKYTVGPDGNIYEMGSGRLAGGFTDSGSRYMIDFDKYYRDDAYRNEIDNLVKQQYDKTTPTMGEPGGIITDGGLRYRINADGSRTLLDTATEQTTPTEDFSDYLNTTTINTNVQTTPAVEEQMISPEDALTPEVPQENPIQKHLDFNEFLKGQGLSQQDYNVLGGYDVAQNLAPGNPILGGAINLASPFYNLMQMFDSAKDAQGNIIKQYVPDMYEDATESGAYYTVPAQKFSDIPGSAARNIQGGLGILTNTQKQQYQDLRNQYETQLPYMDQYQKDYQTRISQVDPNALRNRYLENLQNTSSQILINFNLNYDLI